MTAPAPKSNGSDRFKKIMNASANKEMDNTIRSRLPQGTGVRAKPQTASPSPAPVSPVVGPAPVPRRVKLLQAFWTVASLMSVAVNVVLIAIVLILLRTLGGLQFKADDQMAGLLGGLYGNFVKLDNATISRVIPVDATIPINFAVPVDRSESTQITTEIKLAGEATIDRAHVKITEGGVRIDADATVTLPKDTILTVYIQRFDLPVQSNVPIHLDVPVNIPLRETQLHEAFFGLQQVVQPYYCLVEPNAVMNGTQICAPSANP